MYEKVRNHQRIYVKKEKIYGCEMMDKGRRKTFRTERESEGGKEKERK